MQENIDMNVVAEETKTNNKTKSRETKNIVQENRDKKPTSFEKQAFMYLGPNIPGGLLFSGSLFIPLSR